jgi:prephenate dehydrogenase
MHVNVAIVGLDRVSTSIGLALKRYQNQPRAEHSFTIIGRDTRTQPMKTAQQIGAIDNFNRALLKATDNADLIVLTPPYGETEETLERLGPKLKPGAVVLDLSPLKQPSIQWANTYFPKDKNNTPLSYLVGITPVVNANHLYDADLSADAATAELFDDADILVTPDAKCPSEAIALTEDIIKLLGGRSHFVDPVEHDGLIAATEGLPALLGTALFQLLKQSEGWMELRRMVNPSFALAIHQLRYQSPTDMHAFFAANRANLARNLETLIGILDQLRDVLVDDQDPDQEKLAIYLSRTKDAWEKWDVKRHSGKWDEVQEDMQPLPGPLGSLGTFFTPTRRPPDRDDGNDR